MRVVIPYGTAKFKSANNFAMAILGPTAKFNSRQYLTIRYAQTSNWLHYYILTPMILAN